MKLTLVLVLASLLTACGPAGFGTIQSTKPCPTPVIPVIVQPTPVVVDPADALLTKISALVADENQYRESLGQTALTSGLSCSLYTFTSGDRIEQTIPGHTTLTGFQYVTSFLLSSAFNQPNASSTAGLNILPPALRPVYQNMYFLSCSGSLVVTDDDFYGYSISADDAALLYVDGQLVLNDDNAHSVATVTGQKYLRKGVHSITVQYAQNYGSEALVLQQSSSTQALSVLSPTYFFH